MAPDLNALEPMLIRHGYTSRALSEFLNVRPGEVRALLLGQLPEERAEELKQQLMVLNRSRRRAPNLSALDRLLFGFWTLLLGPRRIPRVLDRLRLLR